MAGLPLITDMRTEPTEFAPAPFASGVPTVIWLEVCVGGLQEPSGFDALPGKSGGPCTRLGLVHWL